MNEENKAKSKSIYDNARNHFLGNFPKALPIEQAYVHIGIYLGWVVDHGLYSEYFEDEAGVQIYRFKNKEISCTILSEIWDGYLGYELFSEEGNLFTYYYYASGIYHKDYQMSLTEDLPSIYHVRDDWDNFKKMSDRIQARYKEWQTLVK